jgi:hypothetical protein
MWHFRPRVLGASAVACTLHRTRRLSRLKRFVSFVILYCTCLPQDRGGACGVEFCLVVGPQMSIVNQSSLCNLSLIVMCWKPRAVANVQGALHSSVFVIDVEKASVSDLALRSSLVAKCATADDRQAITQRCLVFKVPPVHIGASSIDRDTSPLAMRVLPMPSRQHGSPLFWIKQMPDDPTVEYGDPAYRLWQATPQACRRIRRGYFYSC